MAEKQKKRCVVIAMDGSDHSQKAFDWYASHFYKEGDRLVIVYCAEYHKINSQPITLMSIDPKLISNILAEEDDHVKKIGQQFEEMVKKRKMEGKVVRYNGNPGVGICQVAKDEDASLIVTGSRGLGKIRRTILGSVSEYVLHHSTIPVVICKNDADVQDIHL